MGSRSWGGWWSFHRRTRHWRCVSERWAHNPLHPLRSECSLGPRNVCLQKYQITYHMLFYNSESHLGFPSPLCLGLTVQPIHKSNSGGALLRLHGLKLFLMAAYGKTLDAWINKWKLLALSSVILSKKHKRTWMQWASRALYRKPVACQESLAADCFPSRRTSRRTMTFVRPPKSRSEKCRGSLQELMRCSRWANEPLIERIPRR